MWSSPTEPNKPARRPRSARSKDWVSIPFTEAIGSEPNPYRDKVATVCSDSPDAVATRFRNSVRYAPTVRFGSGGSAHLSNAAPHIGASFTAPWMCSTIALWTITSLTLYAREHETELVLGIAMIFVHELGCSDDRVLEALVVVGISSGAVKLREDVLIVGGERLALAAFRRLPEVLLRHAGGRLLTRILTRFATTGAAKVAARVVPLGVGIGVGAGF